MMDEQKAKHQINELVQEFTHTSDEELDKKAEEQIKFLFIEPLFGALGWKKQDIEKESRVLKGRADYIMKLGKKEVLVVEAKRTNIELTEEEGRQVVSYAYHRKIKFAVLTNFREIRIYHALSNIKNINKNLLKDKTGYLWIKCDNFVTQFDRLWLLSRDSFEKEEINKLLSAKDEKLFKPVDKSILADLLLYREWLSKDLKKLRSYLTKEQIDEAVQILINRLIFMRSVEDRNLEERDFLLKIVNDFEEGRTSKRIWESLLAEFRRFHKEYNSEIFSEGLLEKVAFFDEADLIRVIKDLYYGTGEQQEKYMFDVIPVDLFGSIYEQYLGAILSGSEKRVKLESESGKRKEMGIYYTPPYIVDYIVSKTVKEYVANKNLDEILQVRVLDPACGSGSFLVRAFQELCNAVEDRLRTGHRSTKLHEFQEYKDRLSLPQKESILTSCIFGVDLDEKAVELTQLSLLLTLLENETRETRKLLLPEMKENIKCGNSLIDDWKIAGDKAFKWKAQFQEIFEQGGFDIVIGNPPYGAELRKNEREFLKSKFNLGTTDTAALFMVQVTDIVKKNGLNGLIVPKPFVYSSNWSKVRDHLMGGLLQIVDCGKVWGEVKLEQIIYIFEKDVISNSYDSCVRKKEFIECIGNINKKTFGEFGFLLNGISNRELAIGQKIKNVGAFLNDFVINQRGSMYQKYVSNKRSDLMALGGKQIGRYFFKKDVKGFISKQKIDDEKAVIKKNSILAQNIVAHIENPRDHIEIISSILESAVADNYVILDTVNQLENKSNYESEFLLGLINSKLMSWYVYRFIFGKAIRTMHFDGPVTDRMPIPKINMTNKEGKGIHDKIVALVKQVLVLMSKIQDVKIIGNERERLEQQVNQLEWELNEEIYKIYNLNQEEKKIIEESLK